MAFGWCTGTKSVRTHSTNLDAKDLPQHQQARNTQAHTLSAPAHSSFVKLDVSSTVAGQASNGAQTHSTPTSVLDTNTTPDPLRDHPRYVKVAELGLGSSAFVLLAEDKQRMKDVAIKFINRGSNSIKTAGREILNQRLCCNHPNIIQFQEVFLTPEHLAIVSEYAPGGDLVDFIERHNTAHDRALTECEARRLFQQLITGVDFCHQMGIANRDIKLENTLLMDLSDRPVLKLCDFGYSKDELCASISKTMCGTPEYVAPEVLLYNKYAGKMADIWSCGILLYCMLTGCFPFRRKEDEGLETPAVLQKMLPRILKADFQKPQGLTPECTDLLCRLLEVDPDKRITVQQILKHPWFTQDMPEGMANLNSDLLQMPLAIQSGNCGQSEEEIIQLTNTAIQGAKARQRLSFNHSGLTNSGLE
ncbi:hypothetical protein ABBQ38_006728 [Trebouxia sp. C0009 RCD-2024]